MKADDKLVTARRLQAMAEEALETFFRLRGERRELRAENEYLKRRISEEKARVAGV